MNRSQIITFVTFPILVIMILVTLNYFLSFDYDESGFRIKNFYSEAENSMDCMLIGPSTIKSGIIPTTLYEEANVTSYSYCIDGLPIETTKYMIEECLKYQSPKLMIVDVNAVAAASPHLISTRSEEFIRNMKESDTKKRAEKELLSANNALEASIPLIKNHYNWKPLVESLKTKDVYKKRIDKQSYLKGYVVRTGKNGSKDKFVVYDIEDNDDYIKVFDEYLAPLQKLLDYCATIENTEFLFIRMPHYSINGLNEYKMMKDVGNYITNKGWNFIDFSTYMYFNDENGEKLNLTLEDDYADEIHLNLQGAEKFTKFLSLYLKNHYELNFTHTSDVKEHWDNISDKVSKAFVKLKGEISSKKDRWIGELTFCEKYL